MTPTVDSHSNTLRFLESPLVGAWIAIIVVMWVVISGVREYPSVAHELVEFVRLRIALGEACIATFVVLLLLRRGGSGSELARVFLSIATLVASAFWLVPGLAHLESKLPALSGSEAETVLKRMELLRLALGSVDALRAVLLFSLLSRGLERPGESR